MKMLERVLGVLWIVLMGSAIATANYKVHVLIEGDLPFVIAVLGLCAALLGAIVSESNWLQARYRKGS